MQDKKLGIFLLATAAILWSLGGLLIKFVPWNPMAVSGFRSGIAVILMLIYWRYKTGTYYPRITRFKLLAGFNYFCLVTTFIAANKLTTSANAILLQFTAPAWLLIFSLVFLKEKVSRKDLFVVLVVFFGMALFFIGDLGGGSTIGNLIGVLSGICMSLMVISMKKIEDGSPLAITIIGNTMAFFASVPFFRNLSFDFASTSAILLLGIFQLGLAYIFFTEGIPKVTALEGTLIPVLEPLLNPVWVLLVTGEKPGQGALLGGTIVISAVIYKSLTDYYAESLLLMEDDAS